MTVSQQRVEEFREAYRKEYGEDISEAEARDMLTRLVVLCEMLARPLPDLPDSDELQDS
jgi:hypothetical protein